MPAGPRVVLYTSGPDCSLCERTELDLELLGRELRFRLEVVDVRGRKEEGAYGERVPVVLVEGRLAAEGRILPAVLRSALAAAGAGGAEL